MPVGVPLCQQVGAGELIGGEKAIEIDHSVFDGLRTDRVGRVLSLDGQSREVTFAGLLML